MKKKSIFGAALMLGIALGISGAAGTTELKIIASPSVALYGEPFSWKVTGLQPGEKVKIKAASKDARMIRWESEAVFEADASGAVEIGRQAPVSGSYAEADIFGLLWSMKPTNSDAKKPIAYRNDGVNGWMVDLTATNSAGSTAATSFRCVYQRPGEALVRVPLEQDGLRGFLYFPAEGGPFPGVIILGGSEGGLFEGWARALASNGFAALTLAWFAYPSLPEELVEIPLEYFDRAAAWMSAQPKVKAGGLGLMGGSKGGEAALLVASRNSDFRAVVAMTPAAHMWEGHTMKFFSPDYEPVSSWSLGGRPLPYIPFKVTPEEKELERKGELGSFVKFFRDGLAQADPATVQKAAIPVEKIAAPILLVSGTDDQIWPAEEFCEAIVTRLKKARFPYEVKHLSNEKGGHSSCLPFLVTANRGLLIDGDPSGGSPQADARGGYRSWAETIAFLHRHLDRWKNGPGEELCESRVVDSRDLMENARLGPAQVEHAADIPMADPAGELELVREPLNRFPIQGDLGPEELEGDFLLDVRVLDFVNPAHAAMSELLDHLGSGRQRSSPW